MSKHVLSNSLRVLYYKIIPVWMDFWLTIPVALTLYINFFNDMSISVFAAVVICSYVAGLGLRSLLIWKKRLLILAGLLILASAAAYLLAHDIFGKVLIGLVCYVVSCRGVSIAEQPLSIAFPRAYYMISLVVYFFAYLLYGRLVPVMEFQRYIMTGGLIATPSALLMLNSDVLKQVSRDELRESSSLPVVRRNNRLLIITTLIMITAIAAYNVLKDNVVAALKAVFLFIIEIIKSILNFLYTPTEGNGALNGGGQLSLPPTDDKPTSPFWELVFQVFRTIILILACMAAAYFIVKVLIKLYKLIAKLIRKLIEEYRYQNDAFGYTDEKESLMDWQALRHNYLNSIKDWLESIFPNEPKWHELSDNRQRVRYLYRRLILKCMAAGYTFKVFLTPSETLEDLKINGQRDQKALAGLKHLYEKARYSEGTVMDAEVEALKNELNL